ncbi:DNA-processing protein DprA [Amycolatopsis sp. NPDC047767]|uniref:DNA-processing protein DprA n=1 Tax=Amycolatopsis sp. NPDC047767 TaxID=3156765 RepID=UPI0034564C0E
MSHTIEQAWAYLVIACEPPAPNTARLARDLGPLEVVRQYEAGALSDEAKAEFRSYFGGWDAIDHDFAAAEALGARLVVPGDAEWPVALDDGPVAPPLAHWVRGAGRLNDLTTRAVAVIGTRLATPYGDHHAAEIGAQLAERGWAIWNSCSHGIEVAAQRGALSTGRARAAVVVAHGLNHVYPFSHDRQFEHIAEKGLIVSEHSLTTVPSRHRFQMRNRLIAKLTAGLVFIEATNRSGVRSAAGYAQELGHPVLALPGPISSAQSNGCHRLIADGTAELFTTVDDIERALNPDSSSAAG